MLLLVDSTLLIDSMLLDSTLFVDCMLTVLIVG